MLALSAIAVSCSKDNFDKESQALEKVMEAVYFAGPLPADVDKALRQIFDQITTNPEDARIIVVRSSDFSAHSDLISRTGLHISTQT